MPTDDPAARASAASARPAEDDGRVLRTGGAGGTGGSPAPPPRRGRLLAVLVVVCALGYAADQVTKWLALQHLSTTEVVPLVDGWLALRLLFNPGAAFSLGEGSTWLFTGVAVVVVVVIVRVARRLGSLRWAIALGLLLSGALGNLTDRLVREPGFARGHVIDFIAYRDWFVGNVADIWIVGAAAAIALLGLVGIGPDGTREDSGTTTGSKDTGDRPGA